MNDKTPMTNIEIQQLENKMLLSLEQNKLKETFELLKFILSELQIWQLNEKKDELETTYKIMLRYLTEGVQDPEQHHIYEDLLRSCYKLVDTSMNHLKFKYSAGLYYEKKRAQIHFQPNELSIDNLFLSLEDISGKIALTSLLEENEDRKNRLYELEKKTESITVQIFDALWLNEQLSDAETKTVENFLSNKLYPYIQKSIVISALSLSLQFVFDENKALLLLSACENEEEEVVQRALVGLLLFLKKYDNRLSLYLQLKNRLSYLSENKYFTENIRSIILQFILSRETEKITKKIKEEIIPEMMKISPELKNKIKLEDLMTESGMEDKNPEWADILEKSGLKDKLQEFTELQMEGADIMHSSFSHLKTYIFFNEISNWFLPFYTWHTAFTETNGTTTEISETLLESSILCNSDKYSFYFSIAQMPESYRKIMAGQFAAEAQALKEMEKEELPNKHKKAAVISKQYIQDLYRFFKIHPRKAEFEDIFGEKNDFLQVPAIGNLLADKESRMIIGEYYFNRSYFKEASEVFDQLINEGATDDVIYQKKGYCLQMIGDLSNALQAYLKAELLNGSTSWTIKKIAYCYRMLKMPKEALFYYRKAEHLNPDNLSIQLSIGHCYLELKDYQEALKCYFKVEYLDNHGEKAWRPIAWCSFLTGKYKQAMDYLEKILDNHPDASDYLNSGHTQLAMGNIKKAIYFYQLSIKKDGNSIEKFNEAFQNDLPELRQAGVKDKDVPLILDRLMYDTELL